MDQVAPTIPIRTSRRRGFSLVELLVVITVIAVLAAVTSPAIQSVTVGTNLNRGGVMIGDQIALARQESVSKNREVEVRLYQINTGGTSAWRGIQVWRVDQTANGPDAKPISKLQVLPDGVRLDPQLSPILDGTTTPTISGSATVPGQGKVDYRGFRFLANGSTDFPIGGASKTNYLTVTPENDTANPPSNFYTLLINPVTGAVEVLRP